MIWHHIISYYRADVENVVEILEYGHKKWL